MLPIIFILLGLSCTDDVTATPEFTDFEKASIRRMSWENLPYPTDSTNELSDQEHPQRTEIVEFGEKLFFSTALSEQGISCATCHDPDKGFSDEKQVAEGVGQTTKNSPHLWNVGYQTWMFWDGRCDSLWCQATGPIENDLEMASSRTFVASAIQNSPELLNYYTELFGDLPDMTNWTIGAKPNMETDEDGNSPWTAMTETDQHNATEVLVNIAKSIATYETSIITPPAPIDQFIELYLEDEDAALDSLTASQRRGLALFVGEANCVLCHAGPLFSNGEFHNIGLGSRDWLPDTDIGRYQGITDLWESEFNALSEWSDDTTGIKSIRIPRLTQGTEQLGQYKTPSLRNLSQTAPYMHGGHFDTIEEVLEFYNELPETPIQGHREESLQPLELSDTDLEAIQAFLAMLESP